MLVKKTRVSKKARLLEAGNSSTTVDSVEKCSVDGHNVCSSSHKNAHKKRGTALDNNVENSSGININKQIKRHKRVKNAQSDRVSACTDMDDALLRDFCTSLNSSTRNRTVSECAKEAAPVMLDKYIEKQAKGGQAHYQKQRKRSFQEYADFGDKNFECAHCDALFWLEERLTKKSATNQPLFSHCCQGGKIKLPLPKPTPLFLDDLLNPTKGQRSLRFRDNIRAYNSMFAFSSMGARVENSINNRPGPYIFKISGQVHHLMGSLLPPEGECPKFAQLYVYDTKNEVSNRVNALNRLQKNDNLNHSIIEGLIKLFEEANELVKLFRTVRDKIEENFVAPLKLRLLGRRKGDSKQYDQPTSDEIGGLIVGDIGQFESERDIIIEHRTGDLQRLTKLHPKFMALQYPILFPYGEDGYRPDIKWNDDFKAYKPKRDRVPMRAFFAYQIQDRKYGDSTLLKGDIP